MKKILFIFLGLICILIFTSCSSGENTNDSIEQTADGHSHSHAEKDDENEDDTSVNLNYVVNDTTKKETTSESTTGKNEKTTKQNTTEKDDGDNEYPYTNVNDDNSKYEWPQEGLALEIPELKYGEMKKPFISKTTFSVYFADVAEEDFDSYLETLREAGFTVVTDTNDLYMFTAENDKVFVEFFHDTSILGKNTLSLVAKYK